jgi:hypothetical protein
VSAVTEPEPERERKPSGDGRRRRVRAVGISVAAAVCLALVGGSAFVLLGDDGEGEPDRPAHRLEKPERTGIFGEFALVGETEDWKLSERDATGVGIESPGATIEGAYEIPGARDYEAIGTTIFIKGVTGEIEDPDRTAQAWFDDHVYEELLLTGSTELRYAFTGAPSSFGDEEVSLMCQHIKGTDVREPDSRSKLTFCAWADRDTAGVVTIVHLRSPEPMSLPDAAELTGAVRDDALVQIADAG